MPTIPTKYYLALIIIGVVVGYYFFQEYALGGLLALLFGVKGKKKDIDKAVTEADIHKNLADLHKKKAEEKNEQADIIHDEIINIAEGITTSDEKPDTKRTIFRSR